MNRRTPLTRTRIQAKPAATPAKTRPRRRKPKPFSEATGRKVVTARSGGLCEIDGVNRATEWHHRKNRSQGGTWDPANGMHLCHHCHATVTDQLMPEYYDIGWRVKRDQDPAKVPVVIRHNTADSGVYLLTSQGDYIPAYPEVPESVIYGDTAKAS